MDMQVVVKQITFKNGFVIKCSVVLIKYPRAKLCSILSQHSISESKPRFNHPQAATPHKVTVKNGIKAP